jgi:hypothetical protein
MKTLTHGQRLRRQIRGDDVDRIPSIGGWIGGAHNLAALAGISLDAYLANPHAGVIRAHQALDVDGIVVSLAVPTAADQIRLGSMQEHTFAGIEPEAVLEYAATLPDSERELLADVDGRAVAAQYRDVFTAARATWDGIEPIPNFWELGGAFPLYIQFGYTAFLSACALYPDAVGKIWWARSVVAREKAKALAPLFKELDLVPLHFCGEDLCNNQGPMVSPEFLRTHYFPTVRMIIEPLLDAGVCLIHHCDGDVRPVVDDFLAIGFGGLQGFQYELGVDLSALAAKRTPNNTPLLFFAGMSVTRTLPFGTVDDVRREVRYCYDATAGGRGMFLFTANVTGVEVPVENIRAGYAAAHALRPGVTPVSPPYPWPGLTLAPQ